MAKPSAELLKDFIRMDKELDDLYHDVASKMNLSDSAFTIFYIICELGDGCLQRDICREAFANKQTINSSIRKLEQEGYLFLKQGRGRDKHIFFTEKGKQFIESRIVPVMEAEKEAFSALTSREQEELLRLSRKNIDFLRAKLESLSF